MSVDVARKSACATGSGGQVVNQSVRISDVASRNIGLIFDDYATIFQEPALGFLDVLHGDFEDRAERRPLLDEQINMFAMQTEHGLFTGDGEPELVYVESCSLPWILRLNENIGAKAIRHVGSILERITQR